MYMSDSGTRYKFNILQPHPHIFVNHINNKKLPTPRSQIRSQKSTTDDCVYIYHNCFCLTAWAESSKAKSVVSRTIRRELWHIKWKDQREVEVAIKMTGGKYE